MDTAARQTSTTRPDGKVIGYAYDADGNTTAITYPDNYIYSYSYSYDTLDRMSTVKETAPGAASATLMAFYSYNPLSLLSTLTYGNGTTSTFGYDAYNGVTSITHAFAAGSTPPSVTYSYTRDQNERRVGDSVSVGNLWHPPAQGADIYTANALNQYTAIKGASLSYDTNGNLTGDASAPLGTATYQFDQLNRLTSATNSQHAATYTYDPFSRREGKVVDNNATVFVYDGPRVLADYTASGTELQHYVYGAGNTPIAEEVFNGSPTYSLARYHYLDGLGSVVYLADPAGQARAAYSYSPYGEAPSGNSTPYRFAGMRLDSETLLYYDNARYYSPKQGRFISPDPIGVKGGVNIYAYAGNDPLNRTDWTGLDWLTRLEDTNYHAYTFYEDWKEAKTSARREWAWGNFEAFTHQVDPIYAGGNAELLGGFPESGGSFSSDGTYTFNDGNLASPEAQPYQIAMLGSVAAPAAPDFLDLIGAGLHRLFGVLGMVLSLSGDTPEEQYVVRGGIAQPSSLQNGTANTTNGYGFSVQTAPGVSVGQLAAGGSFPNNQISVSTVQQLEAIPGVTVNYPTPGFGTYHGTVNLPYPPPSGIFNAISGAFTQQPNPYVVPR